jgi:hypothetical protein
MTATADTTHKVGLDEALAWVTTVVDDLHHRACALERLVDSGLRCQAEADSGAESDGRPAVATVRVDRAAWFAAVDAAKTPRPKFPDIDPEAAAAAPPG